MKIEKQQLNESKEKLPVSFLTDFVSRGWEDIGYLKATISSIGENFSGTKKVEGLLQNLLDAYLVCVGQLELHLAEKDYLDIPDEAKDESLTEDLTIRVSGDQVEVEGNEDTVIAVDSEANRVMINDEGAHLEEPCEGPDCDVPPVVNPIEPIEVPAEPIAADDGEFNTPFEFDAPEAEGARKFEKPEVADFFVDFDDPVGEPVTEKDLYGEGEDGDPLPREHIDDGIEDEEKEDK